MLMMLDTCLLYSPHLSPFILCTPTVFASFIIPFPHSPVERDALPFETMTRFGPVIDDSTAFSLKDQGIN